MKNFVVLFVVSFSLFLVSCSDVTENSMLTSPVMDKSISSTSGNFDVQPSPVYPYPYLFNFSKVEEVKYYSQPNENYVNFYLPSSNKQYSQLFVIAYSDKDFSPHMYYIDKIENDYFKVEGFAVEDTRNIVVYGLKEDFATTEYITPFSNNHSFSSISVSDWAVDSRDVVVKCELPSTIQYVFAELTTKHGNYLVFLQKPYSEKFLIPEYGKYEVGNLHLFGYQTLAQSEFAAN